MSRPIIPILISYLLGLVVGYNLPIPFHITILLLCVSASVTAASILIKKKPAVFFVFSILAFFILGIGRMEAILYPFLPENHIANLTSEEPLSLEGVIGEAPERMPDKTRLYIDLSAIYIGDVPRHVTGKVLLTIRNRPLDPITTPTLSLKGRDFSNENKFKYGDTIRFLAKVKRPRNFHNPGGFDYERYLALKGIFATAYLSDAEGIVITSEAGSSFKGWIEAVRERIRDHLFKNAGDTAPVLLSLITGEQGEIPKETREAFSRAGTAHILAISGEHVGLIIMLSFAFIIWLLKRSERAMLTLNIYKVAAIMTIPAIVIYSLIAGGGFSIIRAAVMGGTVLAAVLSDRRKDVPSLISFAAFVILAFEPQALFDISFQLSFASVISLAMTSPYLTKIYTDSVNRFAAWLAILALAGIVATIGTAPLVAYYFNRTSIISPVSNLITVPIVGFIIVPLGLAASILVPFSHTLSDWLISVNSTMITLIIKLNELFSSIPFSSIRVVTPNIFEIAIFYLTLVLFIYRKSKPAKRILIAAIAVIMTLESFYLFKPFFQKDLRVTFLDVGQGESSLIEFPGGKNMLIDGGGLPDLDFDMGERVVAPFLWRKRITEIDYLILTHPNSDHFGGLPFILRNFRVGEVWESGIEEESGGYAAFKKAEEESKGRHRNVSEGETIIINGTRVDILNPPKEHAVIDDRAANNGSVVLKIRYGRTSFMFTGDIEKEAEFRLLSKGELLKSTVLKVPHHGSLTSSSENFLNMVRPEKAVFSVGYKNRFGFPKVRVIERFKDIGSEIFRTDRDGAISIISDGRNARFFKSF